MQRQLRFFKIGSYIAFFTAALHMVGQVMMSPNTDVERQLFDLMRSTAMNLPGAPSHTMMDLYSGFSLMFSMSFALTGGLGLIIARRGVQDPTLISASARAIAAAYAVMTVISVMSFFIIPTLLIASVGVCFSVASVRRD
jgi:hypothetical protein